MAAAITAPLIVSEISNSHFHLLGTDDGRFIQPWYRYAVASGRAHNHNPNAKIRRSAKGNHRNIALCIRPATTSIGDNDTGALTSYWGANLNFVEHKSQHPLPRLIASHDVKQSWWVRPIEPEHLQGWNSERLYVENIIIETRKQ